MLLRPALHRAGTPSTKDTGLFCRVPLPGFCRDALGYSPRGTCVSSRYEQITRLLPPFHGHQAKAEGKYSPSQNLRLLLTITVLHDFID